MRVKKQQLEPHTKQLTDSKSGHEYVKLTVLSPCLFNLHAEYIMRNVRLDESQAAINIAGRNNNLTYADDTTIMAEIEEELKEPLDEGERGVKELT